MLTLSEIKSILKEYNIRPSKRLGQNFLIDHNIKSKIVEVLDINKNDTVVEIGPGLGAVTKELCERAKKVVAIEKDKRLYNYLRENRVSSNLELVHGDILNYNFRNFVGADLCVRPKVVGRHAGRPLQSEPERIGPYKKIKVVGNLPYYISSPILIHLLNNRRFIDTIFISAQREFAERLTAKSGSKVYGSISCFVQFYAEPTFLFTIKRVAFYPAPQVDSCFLKIKVRNKGLCLTDEEKLFKIVRMCFQKRRKTILNGLYLKGGLESKEKIMEKLKIAGISPEARPETISLQEFVRLTSIL